MSFSIKFQSPSEEAFNKYRKLEITEVNVENGQITTKKLGSDDNAVEAEEFKCALTDLYDKFYGKKSDEVYKKWMQKCGNIDEPITDAKAFFYKLAEALAQLIDMR